MPAIAIVGAAAAWGLGGAAAIGSVIAGTATLATTLTAVATVGATLGAVGAVTGDKTLSTIGMVMGAVGGVGSLAANAGLFGDSATTASLFGTDVTPVSIAAPDIAGDVAASNDLSSLATMPGLPADAVSGTADALSATGGLAADSLLPTAGVDAAASADVDSLINGPSGAGLNKVESLTGQSVDDATNSLVPGTGGGTLPSGSPTDQASINAAGSTSSSISATDAANMGLPSKGSYVGQTTTATDGTPVTWTANGWAKQESGFAGLLKSPLAQYGAIQAAGSFLSGAFDPLKPAQVDALNAQAANNRAAAAMTTQQTKNMTGALPVASRVTGTPAPLNGGGMINYSPVTGAAGA